MTEVTTPLHAVTRSDVARTVAVYVVAAIGAAAAIHYALWFALAALTAFTVVNIYLDVRLYAMKAASAAVAAAAERCVQELAEANAAASKGGAQ